LQAKRLSAPPALQSSSGRTGDPAARAQHATKAFEVIGVSGGGGDDTPVQIPEEMREALSDNDRIAAHAAKDALGITLRMITAEFGDALADKGLSVQGYLVLSKIGFGGSSVVYLAQRESDSTRWCSRFSMRAPTTNPESALAGVRDHLVDQHPNVVKIYDRAQWASRLHA
jgi:hypothetical protein